MPQTYEPIATAFLGVASPNIQFTSIPSTYTDLKIIFTATPSASLRPRIQLNNDVGTNYCNIVLTGDGSGSVGTQNLYTASTQFNVTNGNPSTYLFTTEIDILSYTSSMYKTILTKYNYDTGTSGTAGGRVSYGTGTWLNTSAVTTVNLFASSSTFDAGGTATLYGILKA